jgi:protoheme IX farnesyltransferase
MYLGLTKPRIIFLILLVALSSYVVSTPPGFSLRVLLVLLISGALSSAGSSALNHYFDRDIDGLMSRTKHRPLPAGKLNPPEKALAFGLALVGAGVFLSWALINPLTAFFIFLGAFIYVVVYTIILKRRSVWNIVIGGFAGSCPALAGSAAAVNAITVPALLIAFLVFLWTPGHFWALSMRNMEDYVKAKVPMLPAVKSERTTAWTILVSNLILPLYIPLFYFLGVLDMPTFVLALAAGLFLLYLTAGILKDYRAAWSAFKFSGIFLMVALIAVALSALLP